MIKLITVLYVKAHPQSAEKSNSSKLANHFLEAYQQEYSEHKVEILDLYNENIPFLDVDILSAWRKLDAQEQLTENELNKAQRMDELTAQFLNADKVIFSAPFWNLNYPPMLKAYIDTICISGKTFKSTDHGFIGLVPDKPVLLIETRGGIFSEGPAAEMQHSERYLKSIMKFIGIENFSSVIAEGLDIDPNNQDPIIKKAKEELTKISKYF